MKECLFEIGICARDSRQGTQGCYITRFDLQCRRKMFLRLAILFERGLNDPKCIKNGKRVRCFLMRGVQDSECFVIEAAFRQQHRELSLGFRSCSSLTKLTCEVAYILDALKTDQRSQH